MKAKALFLDRNGVINVDFGYVHRADQCVFVDGIFDLVRAANQAGYIVVVVTNQAGIARGYYSEAEFLAFTDWMQTRFADHGARLDRVYYCPHHPEAGIGDLRCACACRKPEPGMLESARHDFDFDMSRSIMVGDKQSDIEAAKRAGVGRSFLLANDPLARSDLSAIASLSAVRQAF